MIPDILQLCREIKEKAAKATARPWQADAVMSHAVHDICLGYQIPNAGHPILVASFYGDEPSGRPGDITSQQGEANTRFAVAACNAAVLLAEQVERLLAERKSIDYSHALEVERLTVRVAALEPTK